MTGKSISDAISYEATKRACGWKAPEPLVNPPEFLGWSRADWDTLSPGAKREMERDLRRLGLLEDQ